MNGQIRATSEPNATTATREPSGSFSRNDETAALSDPIRSSSSMLRLRSTTSTMVVGMDCRDWGAWKSRTCTSLPSSVTRKSSRAASSRNDPSGRRTSNWTAIRGNCLLAGPGHDHRVLLRFGPGRRGLLAGRRVLGRWILDSVCGWLRRLLHAGRQGDGRPGKAKHPVELEGEVGLAEEEQRQAGARIHPPPAVRPGAVGLLLIEQDPRPGGVPVEAVEQAKAQGHAHAFERPQVVDVGMLVDRAGVAGHGLERGLEGRVGRQRGPAGRAVCRSARPGRAAAMASPISPAHDMAWDPGVPCR